MEFWGTEIKPGKPVKVEPEDGYSIHVSQVSLGEFKKVAENENIPVYVKVGDDKSKFVIGSLSQKFPQVCLDLFFEQEFELSHNSKSCVFLLGYKTPSGLDQHTDEEIDSDSELDEYMAQQCGALPPNGMNDDMIKLEEDESDSDEMGSDEEESEDEEEEEKAPLKVEPPSKKRPNGGAMNNTVASKKAKVAIQKGGKKKCPFPCGSSCKN